MENGSSSPGKSDSVQEEEMKRETSRFLPLCCGAGVGTSDSSSVQVISAVPAINSAFSWSHLGRLSAAIHKSKAVLVAAGYVSEQPQDM
jgi:hypothetical protein